jgi:hypothetical protein
MKQTCMVIGMLCILLLPVRGQALSLMVSPTISDLPLNQGPDSGSVVLLKTGFSASLQCDFRSESPVHLGAGLCYQFGQIEISPSDDPTILHDSHVEKAHLITASLRVVLDLGEDYYLSLDPLVDLQLNAGKPEAISSQTGLGLSAGCGKQILLGDEFFLVVEPRIWVRNLIPFTHPEPRYLLTTVGLNVGAGIRQ